MMRVKYGDHVYGLGFAFIADKPRWELRWPKGSSHAAQPVPVQVAVPSTTLAFIWLPKSWPYEQCVEVLRRNVPGHLNHDQVSVPAPQPLTGPDGTTRLAVCFRDRGDGQIVSGELRKKPDESVCVVGVARCHPVDLDVLRHDKAYGRRLALRRALSIVDACGALPQEVRALIWDKYFHQTRDGAGLGLVEPAPSLDQVPDAAPMM